jgi:hypothetical protein
MPALMANRRSGRKYRSIGLEGSPKAQGPKASGDRVIWRFNECWPGEPVIWRSGESSSRQDVGFPADHHLAATVEKHQRRELDIQADAEQCLGQDAQDALRVQVQCLTAGSSEALTLPVFSRVPNSRPFTLRVRVSWTGPSSGKVNLAETVSESLDTANRATAFSSVAKSQKFPRFLSDGHVR